MTFVVPQKKAPSREFRLRVKVVSSKDMNLNGMDTQNFSKLELGQKCVLGSLNFRKNHAIFACI